MFVFAEQANRVRKTAKQLTTNINFWESAIAEDAAKQGMVALKGAECGACHVICHFIIELPVSTSKHTILNP